MLLVPTFIDVGKPGRAIDVLAVPVATKGDQAVGDPLQLRRRFGLAGCREERRQVCGHEGKPIGGVPSEMGARSVVASGAPAQAWQGSYSAWPGAKPEVRALCQVTDNGRAAVRVHQLWFPVSWFRRRHEADCQAGSVPEDLRTYCAAILRTRLTVVQLYARPDGLPNPSLSHFNPQPIIRALAAGETAGYRCGPATDGPKTRYCTIWQQLTPEVLAVSSAQLGEVKGGEDPVTDAANILETLVSKLSSKESN